MVHGESRSWASRFTYYIDRDEGSGRTAGNAANQSLYSWWRICVVATTEETVEMFRSG